MSEDPLPEPIFSALLDVLIPARSASLPGAGSLGLAGYVEPRLGEGGSGVASGLGALDARANESHGTDFSALAEGVRAALTSVLFAGDGGTTHTVLAVTSPSPEDGKTTIACNLAISLARIGKKTLLIDADFRRPRLHEVFGISNDTGLMGLLRSADGDRATGIREAIQETPIDGLFVLPSGPPDAMAPREIYSRRLPLLLDALREEYPVILIDTPPMMQIADARVLAQLADAAVLVVRAGRTTRVAARDAESRLARDGTRVLGVVLNGWTPEGGADQYYAYPPAASTDNGGAMAASAS